MVKTVLPHAFFQAVGDCVGEGYCAFGLVTPAGEDVPFQVAEVVVLA